METIIKINLISILCFVILWLLCLNLIDNINWSTRKSIQPWLNIFYPILLIDSIIMFVTCLLGIAKTMDIITIILFVCVIIISLGITLLQLFEYIKATTDWYRTRSIFGLTLVLLTLLTGYCIYLKSSHPEVLDRIEGNTQEVQMFKLEKPNKKSINSFQQEFLQNIIDVATKHNDSNEILLIPVNNKGYVTLDIQTEKLKELEKDNYYKKNKERFEKSLKNNPIEANTLIRILQDDLKNNFEISQKEIKDTDNTENQWIVISWE
jgi:hypothetical protein